MGSRNLGVALVALDGDWRSSEAFRIEHLDCVDVFRKAGMDGPDAKAKATQFTATEALSHYLRRELGPDGRLSRGPIDVVVIEQQPHEGLPRNTVSAIHAFCRAYDAFAPCVLGCARSGGDGPSASTGGLPGARHTPVLHQSAKQKLNVKVEPQDRTAVALAERYASELLPKRRGPRRSAQDPDAASSRRAAYNETKDAAVRLVARFLACHADCRRWMRRLRSLAKCDDACDALLHAVRALKNGPAWWSSQDALAPGHDPAAARRRHPATVLVGDPPLKACERFYRAFDLPTSSVLFPTGSGAGRSSARVIDLTTSSDGARPRVSRTRLAPTRGGIDRNKTKNNNNNNNNNYGIDAGERQAGGGDDAAIDYMSTKPRASRIGRKRRSTNCRAALYTLFDNSDERQKTKDGTFREVESDDEEKEARPSDDEWLYRETFLS